MEVEFIREQDAPKRPRPVSKTAAEILAVLNRLKDGQVAKVTPSDDRSIRGLKTSFGRVASNHGIKVTSWDDGTYLYVKRTK